MLTFKLFMESEEEENIKDTLSKLPDSHRGLVKGYRFTLKGGNTLPGDDEHIGFMNTKPKEIAVAAPWHYGREFTMLHEVAHRVWEELMDDALRQKWSLVVKKNKHRQNQNDSPLNQSDEEIFCMAYAAAYSKHPPVVYYKREWIRFIMNLPA